MAPIAIITVTYSPGDYLRDFVNSVPAAAEQGAHVVMVDNGSTDGAPEAVAAEAREMPVELHSSGGNIGYGAAMNLGAQLLRDKLEAGEIDDEYFVISNPDVIFQPGSIDRMIDAAKRHPRAGAVGPLIREVDGSVYPSARQIPRLSSGIGHAVLGPVWPGNPWTASYKDDAKMDEERTAGWLSGSCLLMRWDAFDSVGGFDERYFMYMEDVDLGDRLARAGWLNIFTPTAEISHAQGHVASKHPEFVLKAHHDSAYRFQADRLQGRRYLPVRAALKAGLTLRRVLAVKLAELRLRKES